MTSATVLKGLYCLEMACCRLFGYSKASESVGLYGVQGKGLNNIQPRPNHSRHANPEALTIRLMGFPVVTSCLLVRS